MQDLIDKIEELKKALTSFKPKSQQNSLVPALTVPSVKPLSMPSVKASAPAKLPGVTQPSGKDPRAMAAQLKNPRPKKPKIEVMKAEGEEPHYALHVGGQRVGDWKPMKHHMQEKSTMETIKKFPDHKLLPKAPMSAPKIAKNGQWSLDEE